MSRIIILSDIYDVRGTGGTKFRSHFLEEEEREDMINHAKLDKLLDVVYNPKSNSNYATGKYVGSSKYNFWTRYMGPYTIASNIREKCPDWDVVVLDYFTKLDNFFEVFEQLVTPDTKYVALSITFLNNPFNPKQKDFNLWHFSHQECLDWFAKIKNIAPNAEIIIGGALVDTFYKQHITQKKKFDLPEAMRRYVSYAFHGYGEKTIVNFLNNTLDEKQVFEKQGVKFINEPALAGKGALINSTRWTRNDAIQPGEWLPLEISKGCRFGCKFCFYDHSGTVIKDPKILREELIYNYENFGTTGYQLTDDTVNDSPAKINMMHDVIKSLPFNIEWIAYTRPDMFYKYPWMLEKMLDMGCRGMFLGVETFNHTAAKIAGKGLHPDKIKDIIRWLRETCKDDVFILASFIIGLVGETEESLMDTARWLKEQKYLDKAQYEILFVSDEGGRTSNEFSENSSKFGIREVRWNPDYYWRHDTLDLPQCKEIALKWEDMMSEHSITQFERHSDYNVSFWAYPRLRSFGLSHKNAKNVLKSQVVPGEVYRRNIEWVAKYHSDIVNNNGLSICPQSNKEWAFPPDKSMRNSWSKIKFDQINV